MSTIEKWAPAHLWRAWDTNWQLAGQWEKQPPMSELADAIALTVDYSSGARDWWRVVDGELIAPTRWDDPRYLDYLSRKPEFFAPWTPDEPWDEFQRRAEYHRQRGDFGWHWMVNGFPEGHHHAGVGEGSTP